jgi:hypothetical protein
MGWGILDTTPRAQFLSNREFKAALADAVQRETGLTARALRDAIDRTFAKPGETGAFDGKRSFFSQAAVEHTRSLTGKILTLTPKARSDTIYAVDEFRTVLDDPNGGPINGIERAQLIATANRTA